MAPGESVETYLDSPYRLYITSVSFDPRDTVRIRFQENAVVHNDVMPRNVPM